MTLHLRCADTSVVLDLPDDRFPVVRHWGPDLGDVSGEDLADVTPAQATSLGTNTAWITNDLPILPLAYLGWNARPAVALSRTDGSAFSPHPTAFTHEEGSEDTPAGTALVVRSSGTDTAHELTLGTELRLEACGLVRLRAWVRNDRPESDGEHGADLVVGELTPVLPLPDSADELLDTTGHHVQERRLVRTPFTPGTRLRESWEGRPGHDAVTWLAAGPTGFGWRSGRVHGVHAAWSGNVRHLAMNPASGRKLLGAGELLLPGEVSLAPGHEVSDPTAGRPGAAAVHDQTLAVYRLLDALHERFPSLEIESCAGGGGRIDLGIMERTQRVWASDCIDAHDRQNIQRGTTLLLPPEMVGTHVGSGRAHTTLRDLDLDFRAGTALWGHMGVEWDLTEADDATRERLASIIALHKELRGLLHSGVTVHADLPDDDVLRIEGVVAPDGSDALFEIASLGQLLAWPTAPRPLPGLDPSRRYHVRLAAPVYPELHLAAGWMAQGVTLPGSYLTTTGLALPVLHPDHLVLLRVSAVD